jgi:hypothetical protein
MVAYFLRLRNKNLTAACRNKKQLRLPGAVFLSFDYSALGAPTGQTSAQLPHSMQTSGLISYLPSPSAIASTGHSAAHAPQEMHSSVILYAIVCTSSLDFTLIITNVFDFATPFFRTVSGRFL